MTTTIGRRSTRAFLAGAAVAATVTLAAPAGAAASTAGSPSGGKSGATSTTSRIVIKIFQATDDDAGPFTAKLDKDPAYIEVTFAPE